MKSTGNEKNNKPFIYYIRILHRDIGFLVIGITLVYCLSGIILTYRDKKFLREETVISTTLPANLKSHEIGKHLKIHKFRVLKVDGDTVYFKYGTYNSRTGETHARKYKYPSFIKKMNKFHMQSSRRPIHIFATVYGVLLIFLAISSFFMYKPGSQNLKRAVYLSTTGTAVTLLILFLYF